MLPLSQIQFVLSNAKDVDSFRRSPTSFDVLSSRSTSREFITFVCTLQSFLFCREIKTPMKILRECKFLYLLHAKMLSFRRDHTFLLRSKRAIVQVVYLSLQATIFIYRETKTHRKTLDCWSIFILVKSKKLSFFKTLHLFLRTKDAIVKLVNLMRTCTPLYRLVHHAINTSIRILGEQISRARVRQNENGFAIVSVCPRCWER